MKNITSFQKSDLIRNHFLFKSLLILLFCVTQLFSQGCDKIVFKVKNINQCCYKITAQNMTDNCFQQLNLSVPDGVFTNFIPEAGWQINQVGPNEYNIRPSIGYIPSGNVNIASFCVSGFPSQNLIILWDNLCDLVGCEAKIPIKACETINVDSCFGNIIKNDGFTIGAIAGSMTVQGNSSDWKAGYGTPEVRTDLGCDDPVYIRLDGNKINGDAVYQQLNTPILKDKVYELSVCVRSCQNCVWPQSIIPYIKIRAVAFNNSISSTGIHPLPSSNLSIINVSGKIPLCGDWTTFVFHRWKAPQNFNNIAISIENSEDPSLGLLSIGDIDNICLVEVKDSIPCYQLESDSLGNIIPPFGLIDPDCPILEDDVDYFNGFVHDIYAYCNPAPVGTDTWYANCLDSCESIGGELPDELLDFMKNDSINKYLMDSLGIKDSILMSEMNNFLDSLELSYSNVNLLDSISSLGALAIDCRKLPPQGPPPDDPKSPFNGMDIVFIHGLRTDPLLDKYNGVANALFVWPQNKNQFYSGYWKSGAYNYWNSHTEKYLNRVVDINTFNPSTPIPSGPIYSNRYIVVSHSVTQPFFVGTHALMEQIANAMLNGTEVINCNPGETRPKNTFGHNGFIIISHSDGAPLTDITLTVSNLTKIPPLNFLLGDVSFIAERCRLHVALQGAFGGSNYASLALMLASAITMVKPLVIPFLGFDPIPTSWLFTSELLDMSITQKLWGPFMDKVPVCVLTLSGGHPTDYGINSSSNKPISYLVKHAVHHGFDDGVLSIESQSAYKYSRIFYPNRFLPQQGKLTLLDPILNEKLFDMGINQKRAIRYYLDQKSDINISNLLNPAAFATCWSSKAASSGVIPWISPTGMVQPVAAPSHGLGGCHTLSPLDLLSRYQNHYSFMQSTADHFRGSSEPNFTYFPNYDRTYSMDNDNCEESRVVTSLDVYSKCGVSSSFKNIQVEYIRGKSKTFTIKFFKKKFTRTFWIWKRKYHLLDGYKDKHQLDYLYKYLLKP